VCLLGHRRDVDIFGSLIASWMRCNGTTPPSVLLQKPHLARRRRAGSGSETSSFSEQYPRTGSVPQQNAVALGAFIRALQSLKGITPTLEVDDGLWSRNQ
jgi:hypothetical protein